MDVRTTCASWFLILCALVLPRASEAQSGLPETEIERAIELALPSVVLVTARESTPIPNENINHYGAGVILDPRGFVLICEHLLPNTNSITVTLQDGTELPATLVAAEKSKDIALVKVESAVKLPTIPIGRSAALKLGAPLLALGNPMGDGMSVSQGILSARKSKLPATDLISYENVLQTDAAINPGNSGGILINRSGEMVGFVVAMRAHAQRMGYAVGVETVRTQLADLLRSIYGTENRLGFIARNEKTGVTINKVSEENTANGILSGDRIRRVGAHSVEDEADFELQMINRNAGELVPLQLERDGLAEPLRIDVLIR